MFWFEIGAADYSYGMGFYSASPAQMDAFRKSIEANPARFERVAKSVESHGFKVTGEEYKRPKGSFDSEVIMRWYNRKRMGLEKDFDLGGEAFSEKLPEILAEEFARLMPMYEYFMEVYRACPAENPKIPTRR